MDCIGNAHRDMTQRGLTEVGPQDSQKAASKKLLAEVKSFVGLYFQKTMKQASSAAGGHVGAPACQGSENGHRLFSPGLVHGAG